MPVVAVAAVSGAIAATTVSAGVYLVGGTYLGAGLWATFSTSTFLLTAGATLALGQLSKALAPKPPRPADPEFKQNISGRGPIDTHKIVYGETRVAGFEVFRAGSGNNEFVHFIYAIAPHEIQGVREYWFNDYVIHADELDANGNVIAGRYKDFVRIRLYNGSPNQTADALLQAEVPEWTADHRLQGIAYAYVRLKFSQDLFPNGVPNITFITRGKKLYDPRTLQTTFNTNAALMAYDYLANNEYGIGALPEELDDANVIAEANTCDEMVATNSLAQEVASVATATDILTLSGDRLRFERGDRVQCTTSGTLPSGISAATNYFVVPWQYKGTPRIKLAPTLADAMAETNLLNITTTGSGTITVTRNAEPRYAGAGIVDTEMNPQDALEAILNASNGSAIYAGGKWRIMAGKYVTPTVELDEGDFIGAINIQTRVSRAERFNSIKGTFVSSVNDFQPTDYPPIYNAAIIAQDGGEALTRDYPMAFTNRTTAAQRMALMQLLRARQEISFQMRFNLKAMQVQAGDTVLITSPRLGWAQKPFEVQAFRLGTEGSENPIIYVELDMRETAPEVYSWTAADAIETDPAPNTNLPNPFFVQAPVGVIYNSRAVETAAGDSLYNLSLEWQPHPDAFVQQGGRFELQFRRTGETDWRPSFFVDGTLTKADLLQITVNESYDLRIRAVNNVGTRSEFVVISGAEVILSGAVSATIDWGSVSGPISHFINWGDVGTAPTVFINWGSV